MGHSRTLMPLLSQSLWSTTSTISLFPYSKMLKRPLKCPIGEISSLMSITRFSMRQQELRENLDVLIISSGIRAELNMPSRVFKQLFLATLEVFIIGITLATFPHQMLTVMKMRSTSESNLASLLWASGKSIGARVITSQLASTYSRIIKMEDSFSTTPLTMISNPSSLRTSL